MQSFSDTTAVSRTTIPSGKSAIWVYVVLAILCLGLLSAVIVLATRKCKTAQGFACDRAQNKCTVVTSAQPTWSLTQYNECMDTCAGVNVCPSVATYASTPTSRLLSIAPRRMWGWGLWADTIAGYCGEGSVQTAGLFFGNYLSQEQVLNIGKGSFLLGTNQDLVMKKCQFTYEYIGKANMDLDEILSYVKSNIDAGAPVIMALYVDETKDAGADAEYDHLCAAIGYELGPTGKVLTLQVCDGYGLIPYSMSCLGTDCFQTRSSDTPSINYLAPYYLAIPDVRGVRRIDGSNMQNHMLSITGNEDPARVLQRVQLVTDKPYEPNYGSEDQVFAPPGPLSGECRISGLVPGKEYVLLRYDGPDKLPPGGRYHSAGSKHSTAVTFTPKCSTHVIKLSNTKAAPFMSNGAYFFRCLSMRDFGEKVSTKDTEVQVPSSPIIPLSLLSPQLQAVVSKRKARMAFLRNLGKNQGPFTDCQGLKPISNNNSFTCVLADYYGSVTKKWMWRFPKPMYKGACDYGCIEFQFNVWRANIDVMSAPSCVLFNMICSHMSIIGENGCSGTIGFDGRLYVDCMDNPWLMSFSLGPANADGSFTMVSQDGVTISKLTPVKDP